VSVPISAVLIVLNGERHLGRVLAALRFCDEIIILDSGSTDRTHEIARAAGARVEHQAFLGYGRQKQRAVELAKHDWVLVVDDDEVLDDPARGAIERLDLGDSSRCWRIRRRTYIGTQEVRHGIWSPDFSLRLFNRTRARFNDATVHESVQPGGAVLTLPGALHHYSYSDYADVFSRMGGYARTKAAGYRARGRRCGALKLAARAVWSFWRSYLFKLGFLDGRAGVIVALSLAIDATCSLAMASEEPQSDLDLQPQSASPGARGAEAGGQRHNSPRPSAGRAPLEGKK
jgi:glycosyltransferase involved in cell wall biosynthesis